jgi:predicted TIM-barrel fold metal-dependent hydrolase
MTSHPVSRRRFLAATGSALAAVPLAAGGQRLRPEWFGNDGPSVAQLIHDSLASVIAKYPTRFRGLCTLPLQNETAAAAELDRCVKKLGFKGILLYTNLAGAWCDEPRFHWLYARAEELGVPILLHPSKPMTTEQVKGYELTSTLGNMFENTIAMARIIASGLLDRHPKLKLVCPHLGGTLPYICGAHGPSTHRAQTRPAEPSVQAQRVSALDLPGHRLAPAGGDAVRVGLQRRRQAVVRQRPSWVQPKEILEPFRSLRLSANTETLILRDNARQLFRL